MADTLSHFDWAVIATYMVVVMLFGIYLSGRQQTTRDYFLGDRTLPWWAVTLSIIATETSAVTYLGFPAKAYGGDWGFLQLVFGFVLGRIFLALFFLRIFYRFDILTVYGYLEKRFGNGARVLAALLFLAGRVVGSAVRLYAACFAIQVASGLPIEWAIGILALLGLGYTLLGGLRSVVWTDCILGITFIAGGIVAIACILSQIDGGWSAITAHPSFAEKMRIFHTGLGTMENPVSWAEFLASDRPLALGLVGGFVLTLATHGTDQDLVQRMLACRDAGSGSRSLIGSALVILPMAALFLAVGSLLWFLHDLQPDTKTPGDEVNHYFPAYIVRHAPAGIAGFLFAGVFAAALSSLTSVLNALSSTLIADFYRPLLRKNAGEDHYLRASRVATVLCALALAGVACLFIGSSQNILDLALGVLTYFYGSLLGVFLLGIFTRRGNGFSVCAGMLLAVPCVLLLQLRTFVENRDLAPDVVSGWLDRLPPPWIDAIVRYVPLLTWSLWIVVGTAVTFVVGMLGRQALARRL